MELKWLFPLWLIFTTVPVLAEEPPPGRADGGLREWTSSDGKKISAEYLGVLEQGVMLKLASGKVIPCPLAKLSEVDVAFVRDHPLVYHATWSSWPSLATMREVEVEEVPDAGGRFIYTTRHFRFTSDVNLGRVLMKDLARVFELTYDLQSKAPLGILASQVDGYYQSELFGTKKRYNDSGGPPNTSGVYRLKEKKILAPLELMGVVQGSAGWRRASKADYDSSTLVHELTHMLTHDLLVNLPLWVNEGYAEYISKIPIEGGAFKTSDEAIKANVVEALVGYAESIESHELTTADIGFAGGGGTPQKKARQDPRKMTFNLFPVARMLTMTDAEWVAPSEDKMMGKTILGDVTLPTKLMWQRYRTAHLILYYFIQIEGERGVAKIRRFLDQNKGYHAEYTRYQEAFKAYQEEVEQFRKQPGVRELPDGRIEYPTTLKPPQAPTAPFTDPDLIKNGGIKELLGSESAEIVGARIEEELRRNLGLNLVFDTNLK